MSDYTPDETELRDCYAASLHEHAGEDYTTAKADAERGIAKIRAEAWDEGAAYVNSPFGIEPGMRNPYRDQEEA